MRARIAALVVGCVLLVVAAVAPGMRRRFIADIITWDAPPSAPAALPRLSGAGLEPADRVRVVLIDGLDARTAHALPTWTSLCNRGLRLTVDVGFPTVSLPVEISLWTGLTQQQTGVMFRSDVPLVPPLDRRGVPARVPDSIAIAEHHGYIVRSLGFAVTEPAAGSPPSTDAAPEEWAKRWTGRALEAVASPSRLAFVHILRVDSMGHRKGGASFEYARTAGESDAILAELVAAAPDARWFLLSDHGHLPTGGHGGEERDVRQVEHCIAGAGIAQRPGTSLVHIVDISRAIADSLGIQLDNHSLARPLMAAFDKPLAPDGALPPLPLSRAIAAALFLLLGMAALVWSARRTSLPWYWLAPWWFALACVLLVVVRGMPTMSMPMVYGKENVWDFFDFDKRLMTRSWIVVLPLVTAATWYALARGVSLLRVVVAQLAVPVATLAATLTACGGWGALARADVSPMVPRSTAWTLVLLVSVSQGSAAVALGVLARLAQQAFGRLRSSETPRSET
jgi:hypothetical protein